MYGNYKQDTIGVFKSLIKDRTDEEVEALSKTSKSDKVNFLDALTRFEMPNIGVYFLFDGLNLVYIGQTIRGLDRLNDHLNDSQKIFDSYSFVKCEHQHQATALEKELIIRYKPPLNKTYAKINIEEQSEFVSRAKLHLNTLEDIYEKAFK
jgi:hypothetical protein